MRYLEIKELLQATLDGELTEHLGYEKHARMDTKDNARNGYSNKTVVGAEWEMELRVPRDRAGTFEPQIVAKRQTRFDGFDDKIIALYARGLGVEDIQHLYCANSKFYESMGYGAKVLAIGNMICHCFNHSLQNTV